MSRETPTPSKNSTIRFRLKTGPQCQCGLVARKIRLKLLHNFGYFATMILLERSMCFFCGLGVSKRIIPLGLCGIAVKFQVLGQAPISGDVQ